ncbi:recombinase family protein [Microbacterium imperiale]|uniref:recombinase family protein n=1 Tax=Microbacterium imperiale TaxID=33884 RepID=UPI0035EE1490
MATLDGNINRSRALVCLERFGVACDSRSIVHGLDKGVRRCRAVMCLPETIVFGRHVDVDEQLRDTPRIDPPKPPAETESRRNLGSTVFGMAHEVGYARVSKREQNPDAQAAELRAAGCERVFVDHGESSRVTDRPQWVACLDYLRPGDTLKVRRLDRLAGSERILIETLQDLDARQVNIVSLTEPMIDTTSPMGRALFGIVAVFAQLRVDTCGVARLMAAFSDRSMAPVSFR